MVLTYVAIFIPSKDVTSQNHNRYYDDRELGDQWLFSTLYVWIAKQRVKNMLMYYSGCITYPEQRYIVRQMWGDGSVV